MFRAILFTQWKWSRVPLGLGTLVAFALPALSVQGAGWSGTTRFDVPWVLSAVESWSQWYPVLAAGLGLLLATTAWSADHRGKHVYALSLPIPRWHFALLRFAAGAVLLLAPLVALWLGGLVTSALVQLPAGLQSYPNALALRFALATCLSYALFSAVSAGTARTAGYALLVVGLLVWFQVMLNVSGGHTRLLEAIFDRLVVWPGPLEVFTGHWSLIDV